MSQTVTLELNDQQRETLLQGLRFVRSSVMLDMRDPTPESKAERAARLNEIAGLLVQLDGAPGSPQQASRVGAKAES